jgi:hypothetical protein
VTAVLLILCAGAVGFAQTAPGRRVAESIGISGQSEPFTELYFAQPAHVGNSAPTGNANSRQRAVSFVIQSHKRTGRTYAWTIKTDTGRRLAVGAAVVSAGGSAHISREVMVCPANSRGGKATRFRGNHTWVQIRVALANSAESISYWTRCDA